MKILALYSIKGGVGKTAAAVNLAYLAAREEKRTLLCDLDPQGAASYYFRIRPRRKFNSRKLLAGGKNIEQNIRGTDYEYLDLLPATLSFRNLDIALDNKRQPKARLHRVLQPFAAEFDYIFIDSPPNLTLLAENIFRAADQILVPCIPTSLSMLTHAKLHRFFRKRRLETGKIRSFFSMVEKRKKLHREIIDDAMPDFLESQIPYLSDIERMGVHREPVIVSRPASEAAGSYLRLWQEIKGLNA